jgi:hypothetical protein
VFFRVSRSRTPRHAAPATRDPAATGATFAPLPAGSMPQRPKRADYADPTGLRGLSATDGFTILMPAVLAATGPEASAERTAVMPCVTGPLPPSQQQHAPWRPPVGGDEWHGIPYTTVRRTRRERQIFTDLPPRTTTAEDSYPSLAAYDGLGGSPAHRAVIALGDDLFRMDESPFDRTFQAWLNRSGVLPRTACTTRRRVGMDTEVFGVVGHSEFTNTTSEGRSAA